MVIIGIVGPMACGKGVIAEYFIKKKGFTSFSLSSLVHEEVKKRRIVHITRSVLQDIGNDMRKKEGDDVLARRAIKTLHSTPYTLNPKIIIEGIRNPGEVTYLRTIPGFFLIAVDAAQQIRYQRVLKRAKPWDPTDWETFLKVDGRDTGESTLSNGQQVHKCMELADVKIENNKGVNELIEKLKSSL